MLALIAASCGLCAGPTLSPAARAIESKFLDLVDDASASDIAACITELEATGGLTSTPAISPLIEGTWQLVHTSSSSFDARNPLGRRVDGTTPGLEGLIAGVTGGNDAVSSSSPIQRAVTNAFRVTQTLRFVTRTRQQAGGAMPGRVEQVVVTPLGELHLNAAACADPGDGRRVLFAFDEGYFCTDGGLRLPYPVPFKLLGKEAEGFLDTSYLGERLRVSTGNKGTTFVLRRVEQQGSASDD